MSSILIVDDHAGIRHIYRKALQKEGYAIFEAGNAVGANAIMSLEKIDLILLDINMPVVKGGEFYEFLSLFHREAKVIVASVYSLDEQRRAIPGAADYFDKAEGIKVLVDKVRKIL